MEDIKQIATDVAHDLQKPIDFCEKAVKVVESIVSSQADVKQVLSDLIAKSEALGTDLTISVADKGANLVIDLATAQDLLAYVAWIRSTVVPLVIKTYGEIKTDVTDAVPTA